MGVSDNVLVGDMVTPDGEWDWARLEPLLPMTILLRIAAMKCPLPHFPCDELGWNGTASNKFTIKSAYYIRHGVEEGPNEDIWRIFMSYKGTQQDVDHVLRRCPQAYLTWKELIRAEKIDVLSLDIKAWIKCNLTNPKMFAKEPMDWKLMFGRVCWYIWKSRNAMVFWDDDGSTQRSILEQA
ncbi:hypothetical protein V6N13_060027 [Hibiscus sabdariffa]